MSVPGVRLEVVGSGRELSALEDLARQRGITDAVSFLGRAVRRRAARRLRAGLGRGQCVPAGGLGHDPDRGGGHGNAGGGHRHPRSPRCGRPPGVRAPRARGPAAHRRAASGPDRRDVALSPLDRGADPCAALLVGVRPRSARSRSWPPTPSGEPGEPASTVAADAGPGGHRVRAAPADLSRKDQRGHQDLPVPRTRPPAVAGVVHVGSQHRAGDRHPPEPRLPLPARSLLLGDGDDRGAGLDRPTALAGFDPLRRRHRCALPARPAGMEGIGTDRGGAGLHAQPVLPGVRGPHLGHPAAVGGAALDDRY